MSLWKRDRQYWIDVTVNGQRYREPLGVSDVRQARRLEKDRIVEFSKRQADPAKRRQLFGSLTITEAIAAYVQERRSQVSPRMVNYWHENGRRLVAVLGDVKLKRLTLDHVTMYQNQRTDEGRAPKTLAASYPLEPFSAIETGLSYVRRPHVNYRTAEGAVPSTRAVASIAIVAFDQPA